MDCLSDPISGERFAALADGERIIFRKRDCLLPLPPENAPPYVLITHNSDMPVTEKDAARLPKNCKRWFAQNFTGCMHERAECIPIGLANSQWPYGCLDVWKRALKQKRVVERLLYVNFDCSTHPIRQELWDKFAKLPWVTAKQKVSPDEYARDLRRHPFVLCPPGNGADTHRVWECAYMGAWPLSVWWEFIYDFDEWAILENDWGDFTERHLEQTLSWLVKFPPKRAVEKLTLTYWRKRIEAAC